MAILKLTDLNGKPCNVDLSLMVKVMRMQTGCFRIVTYRKVYCAGKPPSVEHIINDVKETQEDILLKLKEYEKENSVSLGEIRLAILKAPLEGYEYIKLLQSDGKAFLLDLRFLRAITAKEKGGAFIETIHEVKQGGEPRHIAITITEIRENVKEIAKRIRQNKAFAGLPNVRLALEEVN